MEFIEKQDWSEVPGGNPLDAAPTLWPRSRAVWEAYDYLLLFSDGMGGFSVEALNYYLERGPGQDLSSAAREDVRNFLPTLIREERKIQAEEIERSRGKARRAPQSAPEQGE